MGRGSRIGLSRFSAFNTLGVYLGRLSTDLSGVFCYLALNSGAQLGKPPPLTPGGARSEIDQMASGRLRVGVGGASGVWLGGEWRGELNGVGGAVVRAPWRELEAKNGRNCVELDLELKFEAANKKSPTLARQSTADAVEPASKCRALASALVKVQVRQQQ